jgi:hypothetical protein
MQPNSLPDDDDLLDSAQVSAQMLGGCIKPRTVDSWRSPRRAQPLAFVKVGRRCLYRRGAVREWLAQNTRAPSISEA